MRLCFGFIAANAAAEEAARMAARARRARQLLGKEISVVNSVYAVVDCCTLCTTVLIVRRMQCILCTRRYRMLYTVYKGTPS